MAIPFFPNQENSAHSGSLLNVYIHHTKSEKRTFRGDRVVNYTITYLRIGNHSS